MATEPPRPPEMSALAALTRLEGMVRGADQEAAHELADEALVGFLLGHDPACREIAEAWLAARERVRFWYA